MPNKNINDNILLGDPFFVPYNSIYAIYDENNEYIELIEHSDCFSGLCWSYHHYSQSPLIKKSTINGTTLRHLIKIGTKNVTLESSTKAAGINSVVIDEKKNEIAISYLGLGGGGIGATKCRSLANGILRYKISDFGGEKEAKGTIYLPKRYRVLIAIDDTDSKDCGATWALTHNIAKNISCNNYVYLSQSLVQLYPVPEKTQNCMSTILEFGCINDIYKNELIKKIKELLLRYSASKDTGMLVYSGFTVPKKLKEYSLMCRNKRIDKNEAIKVANECDVDIILDGNGIIGAMAAF